MRFTSQHKAINQKEYGKAVSPLRYDSLALILCRSIFVVYGKQSEKNKYICSSKRHSALHTFWDTTMQKERGPFMGPLSFFYLISLPLIR